jgi:hypothetical protein
MKKKYFILTIEGDNNQIAIISCNKDVPPIEKVSKALTEYFQGEITYNELNAGKDCIHDGKFTFDDDDYTYSLVETPLY